MSGHHSRTSCTVTVEPLADIVVALAVVASDGAEPFGSRYPSALRAEAKTLVAAAVDDEAAGELGADILALGVNRLLGALISRDADGPVDQPAHDLLTRITKSVDVSAVPPAVPDVYSRITELHEASDFARASVVPEGQRVHLWPVRLLPPAPAGKLFARNTAAGQPLRMAFGDIGQVGKAGPLDWAQWYRLGIWHACLNKSLAPKVMAQASPALEAAFQKLPAEHRRKAGVHEAELHPFTSWQSYFLDGVVSAGKVLLEGSLISEHKGRQQHRWLKALGRVHLDWFVGRLRGCDLADLDVASVAADWLEQVDDLAKTEHPFAGPLAACESPPWSDDVEVLFSPSLPRSVRRSTTLWLRGNWPGTVTFPETGIATDPERARLVYAHTDDAGWLSELERAVAPQAVSGWRALSTHPALLYAYRDVRNPRLWTRVCVFSSADAMAGLQQARPPYVGWAALDAADAVLTGDVEYDAEGRISLSTDSAQ